MFILSQENQKSNDLNNSLNELKLNNDTYSSNTLQENQEITTLIENNEPNSIEDLLSNVNNEEVELNFNETLEENNEFKNIDSLNEFEKKEKLLNENNQEQELDFSEDNNLDIIFNEKEETPMVSINKNKEIDYLKELPLNKNNEEPNKIKELEKIINTKTPFVQKEDIINKEPKSVVDLVFQDLPKTNIINDDKLLSPIEVSEYIFKLLEEIETLVAGLGKLEFISEASRARVEAWYNNPPNLNTVWKLIEKNGLDQPKYIAIFSNIVEMVIWADDERNNHEHEFTKAWNSLVA